MPQWVERLRRRLSREPKSSSRWTPFIDAARPRGGWRLAVAGGRRTVYQRNEAGNPAAQDRTSRRVHAHCWAWRLPPYAIRLASAASASPRPCRNARRIAPDPTTGGQHQDLDLHPAEIPGARRGAQARDPHLYGHECRLVPAVVARGVCEAAGEPAPAASRACCYWCRPCSAPGLYLFSQNWLLVILHADYTGFAYTAYLGDRVSVSFATSRSTVAASRRALPMAPHRCWDPRSR